MNKPKGPPQVYYWSRNANVIDDPTINIGFEELLLMSDDEVTAWIDHMREGVLEAWDGRGYPPLNGKTEPEMTRIFGDAKSARGDAVATHILKGVRVPYVDELNGEANLLIGPSNVVSCVNQFFPTMLKTRINYKEALNEVGRFDAYSIYDLFAKSRFRRRVQEGCRRHFRHDSFYRYSPSVTANEGIIRAETGSEWVSRFNEKSRLFSDYGFWLSVEDGADVGSGYTQTDRSTLLRLSKKEVLQLLKKRILPVTALVNLCPDILPVYQSAKQSPGIDAEVGMASLYGRELRDGDQYNIRLYEKRTRIFPAGFTAFKVGYIQASVNFNPMIAKYLYEKYTEHCKNQSVLNVYDPAAGWGGRVAGTMLVKDDRQVHYIGTDPNTDNYLPALGITRYEYLANFINRSIGDEFSDPHTFEIFQLGSELIGDDPRFRRYEGMIDLVLSSPQYFSREIYCDDDTQSARKFPYYAQWRDGFLRPTLETAYQFLRRDRYLLWNIADVFIGAHCYPLERDSIEILKSLGAQYVGVEKMVLANMPGSNRIGTDGKPTAKNHVKMNGSWRKAEPIYVFRKP